MNRSEFHSVPFHGRADTVYEPRRDGDGQIDVAVSLVEFERVLKEVLKRDRFLKMMPRRRRRLVAFQVSWTKTSWESLNAQEDR